MGTRLVTQLIEDALTMAIRRNNPPRGVIHHSDRARNIVAMLTRNYLNNMALLAP
jgi:transposase InsO family protein